MSAACAIATGVRVPTWITPEPSSIRSVRPASQPSAVGASEPHASATQQMSSPSRSASNANASAPVWEASTVVAVRTSAGTVSGRAAGVTSPPPAAIDTGSHCRQVASRDS